MEVILNIGLNTNTGETLNHLTTLRQVATVADIRQFALVQSDTEPTLVVAANVNDVDYTVKALSDELEQDCIAVYYPKTGHGKLVGEKAAAWGDFNPEFFFLLDGNRLDSGLAAAA